MTAARPAAVLFALLVAAGCLGIGGDAPVTTSAAGDNQTATVVDVVDGDTVDVRYRNGTTDTVRLLGVDAPEVSAENRPAEFEGVPDTGDGAACLREAGRQASEALRGRIEGERVALVVDSTADRRDRYGRLLAYVDHAGTDLNRWLVAEGHARVYDTAFARSDAYYEAESEARRAGRGVWECRSAGTVATATGEAPLVVARVHADAAGDDHGNLNDEYVVFRNAGADALTLTGWQVRDDAGHTYAFPDGFTLPGNVSVTLRTGPGTDAGGTLYWGRDSAVWNNGGDTVVVVDADGRVVLRHSYP